MSDTIKELIKRFERHQNVNNAKFSYILERQKNIEEALKDLNEESTDFYSFVAPSLSELDKEITEIKEKIKHL